MTGDGFFLRSQNPPKWVEWGIIDYNQEIGCKKINLFMYKWIWRKNIFMNMLLPAKIILKFEHHLLQLLATLSITIKVHQKLLCHYECNLPLLAAFRVFFSFKRYFCCNRCGIFFVICLIYNLWKRKRPWKIF